MDFDTSSQSDLEKERLDILGQTTTTGRVVDSWVALAVPRQADATICGPKMTDEAFYRFPRLLEELLREVLLMGTKAPDSQGF
jgi:hypothetical protein